VKPVVQSLTACFRLNSRPLRRSPGFAYARRRQNRFISCLLLFCFHLDLLSIPYLIDDNSIMITYLRDDRDHLLFVKLIPQN